MRIPRVYRYASKSSQRRNNSLGDRERKEKKKKKRRRRRREKKNRIRWRSDEEESVFPQETAREGSEVGASRKEILMPGSWISHLLFPLLTIFKYRSFVIISIQIRDGSIFTWKNTSFIRLKVNCFDAIGIYFRNLILLL